MTQHKLFELATTYLEAYRHNVEIKKRPLTPVSEKRSAAHKVGRWCKAFSKELCMHHLPHTTAEVIELIGKAHANEIAALESRLTAFESESKVLHATIDDLRKTGASTSAICFNLGQSTDQTVNGIPTSSIKRACEEWDKAATAARTVMPMG